MDDFNFARIFFENRIPTRNAYTEDRLTPDNILGLKTGLTETICTTFSCSVTRGVEDYRRKRWIATARKATSKKRRVPRSIDEKARRCQLHERHSWRWDNCNLVQLSGVLFWRGPFPFPCQVFRPGRKNPRT